MCAPMPGLNYYVEHEAWKTASSPSGAAGYPIFAISAEDPPTPSTQDSNRAFSTFDASSLEPVDYEHGLSRSHACDRQSDYINASGFNSSEPSELPEDPARKRAFARWYCCTLWLSYIVKQRLTGAGRCKDGPKSIGLQPACISCHHYMCVNCSQE